LAMTSSSYTTAPPWSLLQQATYLLAAAPTM
jgi:hypothetical protein